MRLRTFSSGEAIGNFRIVEVLYDGRPGRSSIVKAVNWNDPGEPVVLKIGPAVQDPNYHYGVIQREVEILRQLFHCGIVAIKRSP